MHTYLCYLRLEMSRSLLGHMRYPVYSCLLTLPRFIPGWVPSSAGLSAPDCSSLLLIYQVLNLLIVWNLPALQSLLWYLPVVHSKPVTEPSKPSFPYYVLHFMLTCPHPNFTVCNAVFPWNSQGCSMLSMVCCFQSIHHCDCEEQHTVQHHIITSSKYNKVYRNDISKVTQTRNYIYVIYGYRSTRQKVNSTVWLLCSRVMVRVRFNIWWWWICM